MATTTDDFLTQPEGRTREYKRDLSSLRPVLKTLVAFANTAGGTLVVGREDRGTVVGIRDPQGDAERLSNAVADGIAPDLLPDIETVAVGDKTLLVAHVARWPGPFYLKAEGPEKGVYVRLGSTTRRAGADAVAEMRRVDASLAFDQLPCLGSDLTDLDNGSIGSAFEKVGRDIGLSSLQSLGVVVRYGKAQVPSNGGIILFGTAEARRLYFPDAVIRCARFHGTEKVHFIDRQDIEGRVLPGIEDAQKFIARNTRLASRIEGLRRQDLPEYPRVALREALVNAVAHADWSARGSQIMVAVFSNRIEIQNPGQLPFGMTIDDIKAGVSSIRNRVIARVLHELDYMETWGTGYKRMRADCEAGGYPLPDWVELGRVTRVVFHPHPQVAATGDVGRNVGESVGRTVVPGIPLNDRQRWFVERLVDGVHVRADDIARQFGRTVRTAERDIAALERAGVVEFVGARKNGYYRVKEAAVSSPQVRTTP
ncbi:putative DNA binding domain-containing protein [Candidatus Fermentibacteria bacterium]|nr:putative DNA binding domain-containing protein [Candidatus Fermentibacteria bacterium]